MITNFAWRLEAAVSFFMTWKYQNYYFLQSTRDGDYNRIGTQSRSDNVPFYSWSIISFQLLGEDIIILQTAAHLFNIVVSVSIKLGTLRILITFHTISSSLTWNRPLSKPVTALYRMLPWCSFIPLLELRSPAAWNVEDDRVGRKMTAFRK